MRVIPPAFPDTSTRSDGPDPVPSPAEPPATAIIGGSERLWHEVHERLTAFVAKRVDDPADVADLVQTVFLRAHQHMASIADEQRLLPWLFQVTRNAIADYYRAPVRRREIGGIAPDGALEGEPGPLHPADPHSASDDEPALRELAGCVRPLVQLLPPS